MTGNISGVILAGGAGKRLNGVIKSKIIIDGKNIISRIIEVYKQIFKEIIIVTNTPDEYSDFRKFLIISDIIPGAGPLGGIHAAMSIATNNAVFVAGGDMPFLNRMLINKQVDYFNEIQCDILIPRIGDLIEPLHGIYSRSVEGALEDYLNEGINFAVRDFLKITAVKYLQLDDSEMIRKSFFNINSPDDVIRAGRLRGLSG
jgi:molybdenum cofactor guanylyltransferase